ncbi:MAG: metallophosphoesterase [Gallionella sp.]
MLYGGKLFGRHLLFEEKPGAAVSYNGWLSRVAYTLGFQGKVRLQQHKFTLSGAEAKLPPLRLGFASDFHAGPLTSHKLLVKAFGMLEEQKPDAILLGGDYVTQYASNIKLLCRLLERLRPPLGIYAVLGNHDYWADVSHIVEQLEKVGVRVLINSNAQLLPPYEKISICGIDDPNFGNPSLAQALKGSGQKRVLLMHSPGGMRLFGSEQVDLVLCGHTHGGQIALPNGFAPYLPPGSGDRKYAHGCFELPRQKGHLIVSKGVGCSGVPVRFFAHTEVHLCEITLQP